MKSNLVRKSMFKVKGKESKVKRLGPYKPVGRGASVLLGDSASKKH